MTEQAGVCADCRQGQHGSHRPNLGGICIGCACPVVVRDVVDVGVSQVVSERTRSLYLDDDELARVVLYVDPLTVVCPVCAVPDGQPCLGGTGSGVIVRPSTPGLHADRAVWAAVQAARPLIAADALVRAADGMAARAYAEPWREAAATDLFDLAVEARRAATS